ncbi:sensor histidine kinase [Actinomadura macrotermitis]|uniref:histidine kinase n=1 Tax=Actinomadura macrotermitis TaxID=2585200 RepID=A0A7K0BPP7_9ACTN|nr:sensor histidine kinase [Actinomadura macrotermitis]MQY03169.1 hypothetical protein [Actinomadura macrotermitis]
MNEVPVRPSDPADEEPGPPRSRRRSIRFTLFGLLAVPLVSLVALWAFAAQSTVTDALQKRNLDTMNRIYGDAATPVLVQVGQERLESVTWLSGRGRIPRTAMDAQRRRTDGMVDRLLKAARSSELRDTLTGPMKDRLDVLVSKIGQMRAVRQGIDGGTITKLTAFGSYNDVIDAHMDFVSLMIVVKDAAVYQQANHLIEMSFAQELAAREATLVGGALIQNGRMAPDERLAFARNVFEQRLLVEESLNEFEPRLRALYERVLASPDYQRFRALEDRIVTAPTGRHGAVTVRVDPAEWRTTSETYIGGLAQALVQTRNVLGAKSKAGGDAILLRLGLVGGLGLVAVLLSAFLMLRFGRRVSRELNGLRTAARDLAQVRLPQIVERLSRGEDVCPTQAAPPLRVGRTTEVADVAEAFSTVQRTAISAAVGQADLRKAVNQVFQNLARRNQSLLHRQLAMLDTLERKAADPEALEDLFRIDHLTTRMRRHAEGLIILSGATPGRGWRRPVRVVDVLRGAIGEIEDYARVEVVTDAEEAIVGGAVADIIHLIAELVENAVAFSPPNTHVEINAGLVGNGFVVEIQDRGLGMSDERLAEVNERLARPPRFDLSGGDQLGLFVVGHLAHKHGIRVSLVPNAYGGLKTIVLMPHAVVVTADQADAAERAAAEPAPATEPDPQPVPAPHSAAFEPFPPPVPVPAPVPVPVPVPAPVAPTAHPPEPAAAPAGTHAGMPRRVRRAHLAPQLRDHADGSGRFAPDPPAAAGEAPRPGAGRSPEQARSVMASMQSGWRRGRAEDTANGTEPDTTADQDER